MSCSDKVAKRRLRAATAVLLAAVAMALTPPDAVGQDFSQLPWAGGVRQSVEDFDADDEGLTAWLVSEAFVRRRWEQATAELSVGRVRRFSLWDERVSLDSYIDIRPGTYVNVRVQRALAGDVLPDGDYMGEIYRGLGGGWEASAGYRLMDYGTSHVSLLMGSLAKYVGNWYVRERVIASKKDAGWSIAHLVFVRKYLATADDYWEILGGAGSSPVQLGAGDQVEILRNWVASFRLVRQVRPNWSVSVSANANFRDELPNLRGFALEVARGW